MAAQSCRPSEQHKEGTMKRERMKTRQYQFLAGALWCVLLWFGSPARGALLRTWP